VYGLLGACALLSVGGYFPIAAPVTLALVYMHFAENALFHGMRLSDEGSGGGTAAALVPILAVFAVIRLVPELLWTWPGAWPGWITCGQVLALVGFAGLTRWLVGRMDLEGARAFAASNPLLVSTLLGFTLVCPATSVGFDFFTQWHFAMWFGFTWIRRPDTRRELVLWHGAFAALYGLLFWTFARGFAFSSPLLAFLLLGPLAYQAQALFHTLVTAAFRRYEASAG